MPRRPATNRIQCALDELGIDWRSPRYGRPRLAGEADVIVVPDEGVLGSLLGPLRADGRMDLDARQPPAALTADAWDKTPFWRNASRSNLRRVASVFQRLLGAPDVTDGRELSSMRWHDQAGSITLTCRPDGTPLDIESDPRLASACRIVIVPGWRRPISDGEITAISNMSVIGRGSPRGVRMLTTAPARDEDAAFVREPGPDPTTLDAIIGVDAEAGLLVACPGRLLVVPVSVIEGLRHETYEEGLAPGRSVLKALLEGGKDLVIGEHDETHGLELVSRGLSRALNLAIDRKEAIAS